MKLVITKKQSKRLIKESMGVPKSIEFWVDVFSSLIQDGLLMLLSSEDKEVFFTGDDVQEKAVSSGWNSSNDKFLDFPLAEPQLNLKLNIVPDDTINSGDDYIDAASFDTSGIDLIDATFDDGKTLPLLVGGLIKMEISIPESSYENGSFVELYSSEIKPYAESILFHELTHVYEFYKRILSNTAKPNFEQAANLTQMMNKMGAVDDWDELMFMIYLHLSFELNARISEVYGLLRNKNITSKEDFVKFLKTSRAFSYAKRLNNFSAERYIKDFDVPQETIDRIRDYDKKETSIEEIKDIVLTQFIDNWSGTYESFLADFSADENLKIPNLPHKVTSSPENFLKFWEKRFNKAGEDSIKKISRLYSLIK
tara:strand:- start:833 stop:1936 length:1104 start_codon:yes stop_codon:yes gene_type:complete